MSSKPKHCIRCHPLLPGSLPITGPAHFICDACMQKVNHPRPHLSPAAPPAASPDTDGRKSSKKRGRKAKAVATALVLMLLPFVGCTIHRETTLDIAFDPADVLRLAPQEPAVKISTPGS